MPSYVVLGNLTEQGVQNVKTLTSTLEQRKDALQQMGARMVYWYLTLGQYDFFAVIEAPDADTAGRFLLTANAQGAARTTTLQAFTEEETAALVAALP